jgi:hypothetical protein
MQAQALRMRRPSLRNAPRFGNSVKDKPGASSSLATGERSKPSTANDWSPSQRAEPLVEVGSRPLTQQAPGQNLSHSSARTSGKAHSALPSSQSGAAAAEYGSRHNLLRASARSTANSWSSLRLQRGAGSVRRVFGCSTPAGLPSARPNPSFNPDPLRQAALPAQRTGIIMRRAGKSSCLRGQG